MEEIQEDDMNVEAEYIFTVYEIDLDFEFDAPRFFDFTRPKSTWEEHQAELWFDSTGSYPPSPYVSRLVPREEILMENVNTSPKPETVEKFNLLESDYDIEEDLGISSVDMKDDQGQDRGTSTNLQISCVQNLWNLSHKVPSGFTFNKPMINNHSLKTQTELSTKPSFQRTSTLMKPTASQLAKQNHLPQQAGDSRGKIENNTAKHCGNESQAAKRQKLDGGHLRKVAVVEQQNSYIHKARKGDGTVGNASKNKLRLTIPREPDLETGNRSQRIRPHTGKKPVNVTSTLCRFRALPLNRKILEAPSLLLPKRSTPHLPEFHEFHLKTSERAMQHTSLQVTQKSRTILTIESGNGEPRSLNVASASRQAGFEPSYHFKALPLNKKILTSKGNIGVSGNSKKDTTAPVDFNFQTEKRFHYDPPIQLFNKLSLASKTSSVASSKSAFPQSNSLSAKDSEENRWGSIQEEYKTKQVVVKSMSHLGGRQIQHDTDGKRSNIGPFSGSFRTVGIR